jgi:hypothetical protein
MVIGAGAPTSRHFAERASGKSLGGNRRNRHDKRNMSNTERDPVSHR